MHQLRRAAVVAVATVATAGAVAASSAAAFAATTGPHRATTTGPHRTPAFNPTDIGLYGKSDPTFDGVFRQSLALLGEAAVGSHDPAAISWLVDQQCADGGWTSYRATLTEPCPATDLNTFAGEDSNSTAIALEALHALGVTPKHDGLPFLHSLQDTDGGFSYLVGSGSDPNSTGLVVQALDALGQDPTSSAWTTNGKTAIDGLMSFWLNCGSPDPGAFASPYSSGHGDLVGSVQAVWGAAGHGFPFAAGPVAATQPTPDCTGGALTPTADEAAGYAVTWIAGKLQGAGYLTTGSSPDPSLTAQGVLAMASTGTNSAAVTKALTYLRDNIGTALLDSHGNLSPGTLGYLALAVHALGQDPTEFAGHNLIADIKSTRRAAPPPVCVNCSGGGGPPPTTTGTGPPTPRAGGTGEPTLPATGRDLGGQLAIGLSLSLLGVVLLAAGRPRRRSGRHRAA